MVYRPYVNRRSVYRQNWSTQNVKFTLSVITLFNILSLQVYETSYTTSEPPQSRSMSYTKIELYLLLRSDEIQDRISAEQGLLRSWRGIQIVREPRLVVSVPVSIDYTFYFKVHLINNTP